MAKFYNIDPNTCSLDELRAAIAQCEDKVNLYSCLEQGCKRFINSVYGALASKFYQCSNIDIAESITLQGQDLIKFSVRCCNKFFDTLWNQQTEEQRYIARDMKEKYPDFDVDGFLEKCKGKPNFGETCQIYGDTDSAYVTLDPLVKMLGITNEQSADFILLFDKYMLSPYLEYCFDVYAKQYNCKKNLEKFELEKIARTVLMQKKKKYVMDISWKEPDIHVKPLHSLVFKGVEVIKGTSSLFCRNEQREFVKWIMDNLNNDKKLDYGEIVGKLRDIKKRFIMQNPNDMCMTQSISDYEKYVLNDRGLDVEYVPGTVPPMHVKASARYNNMLYTSAKKYRSKYNMIHKGDKIKIYYIKGNRENAFAFIPNAFPMEFAPPMDVDIQFEKLILDPLNRYIEALGYAPVSPNLTYSRPLW